ncbi:hypothetical protein EVAR_94950_1 [Eumeta japonica]|uniref:non-specific serine/threonine protein kinase n=1 Tax=Eumeta variegata TaxID=151549 RepID=A0A4C1UVR2_EUMVA|nr:hypothetical protein EVAR_94950_1 [Eumeta japonica]
MCSHSPNLVTQAAIISEELIRVAILWHDQWYIALDEASRLYFSDKDNKGMLKTLEPLHAMLERGPQTLKEISFLQNYGRELKEAQEWCNRYKKSGNDRDLNHAWDLYYHVYRRISAQFRSLTSLELQYVSPRLLNCRDLDLVVPGSYVPDQEVIRISYIHSSLQVIKSKQRPRRLGIRGSNGAEYMFLLKGHEDLRQDERVMQLFGLVNTLLQADAHTARRNLAIQRYAVIPLSTNSGLIGWVPHCDTLYNLIIDYREKKANKMAINTEQQIMNRMTSDLQKLMLMQKVEVFEHTLEQTPGNDLARLLWLKSPSAESWFERRTNYTRSLAVMSMVGYILGLGDRHPSNIMLHRVTGKVLHIDFGDCFEVTLAREKFPEKIPFRLTRMLINAMEVTGIEGTYRCTCESVMEVLHKHKESVMAVLEAFVYDPLLNWRLVDTGRHSRTETSLGSSEDDSPSTLPSRSRHLLHISESIEIPVEINLNKRALAIVNRVRDKLTGRDFPSVQETVSVKKQVHLLIQQATNNENLCQCYIDSDSGLVHDLDPAFNSDFDTDPTHALESNLSPTLYLNLGPVLNFDFFRSRLISAVRPAYDFHSAISRIWSKPEQICTPGHYEACVASPVLRTLRNVRTVIHAKLCRCESNPKTSQWRKIGTRGRRRKGREALNLRIASFARNSER